MSSSNSKALQKGFLLTLFQLVIILLLYTYLAFNNRFDTVIQPKISCTNISDINKLCISTYERNQSQIPYNKGVFVESIRNNPFKMLVFEESSQRLNKIFHNQLKEYFQMVDYNSEITSIERIRMNINIQSLKRLVEIQKGQFIDKAIQNTHLNHTTKFAVFYFILPEIGPIANIASQIRIIQPNNNSVLLNNQINIVQCLGSVILIIVFCIYTISKGNINLTQYFMSAQAKQRNRCLQFLLNFGMSNLMFYLTVHKFWSFMGINFVSQTFRFQQQLVPMTYANPYESYIMMFPEWLLLAYFIHQVLSRYFDFSSIKLLVLSGLSGGILFLMPLSWPQFIFQFAIILIGIIMGTTTTYNSNNRLTMQLVSTGLSIICMVSIKIYWINNNIQQSDFGLRFIYYQTFILSNILSLFFKQEQTKAQQNRKYIPYEEHSIEEQGQFQDQQIIPSAQKV